MVGSLPRGIANLERLASDGAMDEERFFIVRETACDSWFFYEKYRLAYSDAYERTKAKASILSWCTIALGALTTACATLQAPSYVTAAIAVLTTITAGLQQTFKWDEKALQFWAARSEMEQTSRDIKRYVSDVALSGGASFDPLFEQRLTAPKLEVQGVELQAQRARTNLEEDAISTLQISLKAGIEPEDDIVANETEVIGMTPKQRP